MTSLSVYDDKHHLISTTGGTTFYRYDGFGSVRQLTDVTGAVTDTYDYDAWGNTVSQTGSTPNLYRYRGEQYDPDLNLYYLRARYFNPLTGRFLTLDPEAGRALDPRTLHKYLYAGGDSVNAIDPNGRSIFGALYAHYKLVAWSHCDSGSHPDLRDMGGCCGS